MTTRPESFNRISPSTISPNRHARSWAQMVTKYARLVNNRIRAGGWNGGFVGSKNLSPLHYLSSQRARIYPPKVSGTPA